MGCGMAEEAEAGWRGWLDCRRAASGTRERQTNQLNGAASRMKRDQVALPLELNGMERGLLTGGASTSGCEGARTETGGCSESSSGYCCRTQRCWTPTTGLESPSTHISSTARVSVSPEESEARSGRTSLKPRSLSLLFRFRSPPHTHTT